MARHEAQAERNKTHTDHLIKQPVYYVLNKFTIPKIIFKNLFEWARWRSEWVSEKWNETQLEFDNNNNSIDSAKSSQRQHQQHGGGGGDDDAIPAEAKCTQNDHLSLSIEMRWDQRTNERTTEQTIRRTMQTNGRHTLSHIIHVAEREQRAKSV